MANPSVFEDYFRRADLDKDGRISGAEAVSFFQGANLPQVTLAKVWQFADQGQTGFLSKLEFYNALKLVTVAQTGRELTQEIVRAALAGPAAAQIPAPHIVTSGSQSSSYGVPRQTAPSGFPDLFSSGPGAPPKPWASQPSTLTLGNSGPSAAIPRPGSASGQRSPGTFSSDTWPSIRLSSTPTPPSLTAIVTPTVPSFQAGANSQALSQDRKDSPAGQGFQPGSDDFFSGVNATKSLPSTFGSSSLVDAFENDLFAAAPKAMATRTSEGLDDLRDGGFSLEPAIVALVPNSVASDDTNNEVQQSASMLTQSSVAVLRQGFGNAPPADPVLGAPWPRLTPSDAQRYTRVFAEVDTDRDGKITGEQARDLFLSWRLPREVLKQVWDLSDQDGDSMLSMREFCTALYLMERYREGRPLPPVLPSSFPTGLLQPSLPTTVTEQSGSSTKHISTGHNALNWQEHAVFPVAARPLLPAADHTQSLPTPNSAGLVADNNQARQYKSKVPALEMHLVNQLSQDEQDTLRSRHKDAEGADRKAYELDKEIMDYREKAEFYRSKLQEIILFKSRCENRLSEITEKAASDQREMESLAKKYDERFKAAGEVNSRLLAEEAVFQDIKKKKIELCNAITNMEQGGDANALLQSKVDLIFSDLHELKKALSERAKKLGLNEKATPPTEQQFGWQNGLQENAADWDKFDDEGFVSSDYVDDTKSVSVIAVVPKPGMSLDESNPFDDGVDYASIPKSQLNVQIPEQYHSVARPTISEHASPPAGSAGSGGSDRIGSPRSGSISSSQAVENSSLNRSAFTTKANQRYANPLDSQEDILNGLASYSSTANSFDLGQPSYNSSSDTFGNRDGSWIVACDEEVDSGIRASWGLQSNPPSTQASLDVTSSQSSRFGKTDLSSHGFVESLDMHDASTDHGSGPTLSHGGNGNFCDSKEYDAFEPIRSSKDFDSSPSFLGSNYSTHGSNTVFDSPGKSEAWNDQNFGRFDLFSSPQNNPVFCGFGHDNEDDNYGAGGKELNHQNFARFDSFSSTNPDGGHRANMFHSINKRDDLFIGTGPSGTEGQEKATDYGWRANF